MSQVVPGNHLSNSERFLDPSRRLLTSPYLALGRVAGTAGEMSGMRTTTYRTGSEGEAICAHRDLSVCDECATDPTLVAVAGVYYQVVHPEDRAALLTALAHIESSR